jgi:hypothetical protein
MGKEGMEGQDSRHDRSPCLPTSPLRRKCTGKTDNKTEVQNLSLCLTECLLLLILISSWTSSVMLMLWAVKKFARKARSGKNVYFVFLTQDCLGSKFCFCNLSGSCTSCQRLLYVQCPLFSSVRWASAANVVSRDVDEFETIYLLIITYYNMYFLITLTIIL